MNILPGYAVFKPGKYIHFCFYSLPPVMDWYNSDGVCYLFNQLHYHENIGFVADLLLGGNWHFGPN